MASNYSDLIVNNTATIATLNFTGMNCNSLTSNGLTITNAYVTNITAASFTATNNLRTPNLTATTSGNFNGIGVSKGSGNHASNIAFGTAVLTNSSPVGLTGHNIAIGYNALTSITSQTGNIAIGENAMQTITGNNNIGINVSMLGGTGINNSIGIGYNNLPYARGDNKVSIGVNSGNLNSGNNTTTIGANANIVPSSYNNTTAIGSTGRSSNHNQISFGGAFTETIYVQGGLNYNTGETGSTATISTPAKQFIVINNTTAITITLPSVTPEGTLINFKRGASSNGSNITFAHTNSIIIPLNSITATSSVAYASSYNFQFISNGTYWYQTI